MFFKVFIWNFLLEIIPIIIEVNGNIEATGTISASSFLGNASSASYPAGFGARLTSSTWGAISSASYTCFSECNAGSASDKGGIAFMGYPS